MNHNDNNDWRKIAHDEYENRKSIEVQLERTSKTLSNLQQSLTTSSNYNSLLEQKLAELERKCAEQDKRLARSVALLKNAKRLIDGRKRELTALTAEKLLLQQQLQQTNILLEAEKKQHKKTKSMFAKLSESEPEKSSAPTLALPPPVRMTTSPDVIYAEGAVADFVDTKAEERDIITAKRKSLIHRMFESFNHKSEQKQNQHKTDLDTQEVDTNFMDQVLYIDKQYNK